MYLIFHILLQSIICNYKYNLNEKTKVLIHLEKFNKRYNLIHIGISFYENNQEPIRFDYRAFNDKKSYITTEESRKNVNYIFPDIFIDNRLPIVYENEIFDGNIFKNIQSKNILWGYCNKSINEILEYENLYLRKRYKLGIYDCRHYVNKFTLWCMNKPTPIWNLHKCTFACV